MKIIKQDLIKASKKLDEQDIPIEDRVCAVLTPYGMVEIKYGLGLQCRIGNKKSIDWLNKFLNKTNAKKQ